MSVQYAGRSKKSQKITSSILVVCALFPLALILVLKPAVHPITLLRLQSLHFAPEKITTTHDGQSNDLLKSSPPAPSEEQNMDQPITYNQTMTTKIASTEFQNGKYSADNHNKESTVTCNFKASRSDTCSVIGDVRVHGKSLTIILASPLHNSSDNTTWKVRPYARKWETSVMQGINELTLIASSDTAKIPSCTLNHSVPIILFSTGGFLGNYFHDFTDVLIPMFTTSRRYNGEVQFMVTNYNAKWIERYQPILKHLTNYEIINMDLDDNVHCFPSAHLGLISNKILSIDSSTSPNGYTMQDFRDFLRMCLSLDREVINPIIEQTQQKPRLLITLRRNSRLLMNEAEVISMAQSIGFEVITALPEDARNLSHFARIVNSCDVFVGVHGAGLTNMVFLPTNATLIQIIPWGAMKWACWHDFGEPAPDMRVNYIEYEITEDESTLTEKYPRDHPVFKDPLSIHKQGFNLVWSIFLNEQNIKINVTRFGDMLAQVFQSLKEQ